MKSRFQAALESRIKEDMQEKAISLANGTANDYARYQYWVGYIAALHCCIAVCEDIEKEME